jgi:hypothetical protein
MQKIPRCPNSSKTNRKKYKKYHAVATVQKPIEKIPRCRNSSKTNRKNTTLSQQLQNQ